MRRKSNCTGLKTFCLADTKSKQKSNDIRDLGTIYARQNNKFHELCFTATKQVKKMNGKSTVRLNSGTNNDRVLMSK